MYLQTFRARVGTPYIPVNYWEKGWKFHVSSDFQSTSWNYTCPMNRSRESPISHLTLCLFHKSCHSSKFTYFTLKSYLFHTIFHTLQPQTSSRCAIQTCTIRLCPLPHKHVIIFLLLSLQLSAIFYTNKPTKWAVGSLALSRSTRN